MAEIVASVFAESVAQVHRAGRQAAMAGADWLELRLDRWPAEEDLTEAFGELRLPVLVACRSIENGGQFRGSAAARRELLLAALAAGAQGLDLELDESLQLPRRRPRLLVRSFHSYTGVPKELAELQQRLHAQPGTVAKIVVTAHDLADAAPVLDLLAATDQQQHPTVAFALGRTAWPTRILACLLGAPLVYGCLEPGSETAPGQPPVQWLSGLYRCRELSTATALYGLLGDPALGSLGPWLHNRCFRRQQHDGIYLPLETARPAAVLAMLPRRQLRGLSVTAPWKELMAGVCHQLSEEAAAATAINTIVAAPHGMLVGHNTDVVGIRGALELAGVGAGTGQTAVVIGGGGAARAAVVALQQLGFAVHLLLRSPERIAEFARLRGCSYSELTTTMPTDLSPRVVVQATPLGSGTADRPLPDWRPKPGTVVLETVYQPRWTPFLRAAQAAGAVAVPGATMFLLQAAEQQRLFGRRAVEPAALRACLAGSAAGLPLSGSGR